MITIEAVTEKEQIRALSNLLSEAVVELRTIQQNFPRAVGSQAASIVERAEVALLHQRAGR